MRVHVVGAVIVAAIVAGLASASMPATSAESMASASESRIQIGKASLYARDIGKGSPVIVLHGGPDFDHRYLLPDLDRLAASFRLIYYDQRGRGNSVDQVNPQDVTLQSDLDDLDMVRRYYRLESPVLLGHSWGTVIALEYVLQHPTNVSCLILLNPAPASTSDYAALRKAYVQKLGADMDRQKEIIASAAYQSGDPEAVAARYRIHFKYALARQEDFEKLMVAMRTAFIRQGKAGILKARAVEDRLYKDTWDVPSYNLMPRLAALRTSTLVIWGDHDFIPEDASAHIAEAIPGAQLVTLKGCGHFSYLECPDEVGRVISEFLRMHGPH